MLAKAKDYWRRVYYQKSLINEGAECLNQWKLWFLKNKCQKQKLNLVRKAKATR